MPLALALETFLGDGTECLDLEIHYLGSGREDVQDVEPLVNGTGTRMYTKMTLWRRGH